MTQTAPNPTTPTQPATTSRRNYTRTWKVKLYGDWGEGASASVFVGSHIVTLTADGEGRLSAEIDGQPQENIERAIMYLNWTKTAPSSREILSEGPTDQDGAPDNMTMAPATIGKARAHQLHKIMGALGLPHAQHYGIAAYALDEPAPLHSLSSLTDQEAARVWAYLASHYPDARAIGQRVKAKAQAHAA